MTDRVLNTALLNRIIDWLDAGAPHTVGFTFDMMGAIVLDYDEIDDGGCGTSCCIAGAALAFADEHRFQRLIEGIGQNDEEEVEWASVGPPAAKLLGISGEHAEKLFFMVHTEPSAVAKALRDYRDTGALPERSGRYTCEFGSGIYA